MLVRTLLCDERLHQDPEAVPVAAPLSLDEV